jgi:hypothetical protein
MRCILTTIVRTRRPIYTFNEDLNMFNKLLKSEYFQNTAECLKDASQTSATFSDAIGDAPTERHTRWAEKGLTAGAIFSDTLLLTPRLLYGTGLTSTTSMNLKLTAPTLQSKGLLGMVNAAGLYLTGKLGQGVGLVGAGISLPVALATGTSTKDWLTAGMARGALLGAAVGRISFGNVELTRALLAGAATVVGYAISQNVALWFYAAADIAMALSPNFSQQKSDSIVIA